MKLYNKASELRFETMDKIIKDNKGVPPLDLAQQVESRISDKTNKIFDKIYSDFVEGSEGMQRNKIMDTLPSAIENKGREIKDWNHGGIILQSNGQSWVRV
jgi:hypothetical protein